MVSIKLSNGINWSMHKGLKANLDILLNDVKNSKMDLVIIIDGPEGLGKSFMARGVGMYCATRLGIPFSPNDIQFDLAPYISESLKAARDGIKHKINLLDEARKVLNRARGGSGSNVKFTNYLSECRALGQVHIILAPAFHDLDKYLVLWRMSILIHCVKNYKQDPESETGVSLYRGEYKAFVNAAGGKKALNTCWEMKNYTYPHAWEVHAMWPSTEVFTSEQLERYEKKKFNATLNKYYSEEEDAELKKKEEEALKKVSQEWFKSSVFAKMLGIKNLTIVNGIKEGRYKGKQFGRLWYVHKSELEDTETDKPLSEDHKEMRRNCAEKARAARNLPNSQPNIDKKEGGQRQEETPQTAAPPLTS